MLVALSVLGLTVSPMDATPATDATATTPATDATATTPVTDAGVWPHDAAPLRERSLAWAANAFYALGVACLGQLAAFVVDRAALVEHDTGARWLRAGLGALIWAAATVLCATGGTPGARLRRVAVRRRRDHTRHPSLLASGVRAALAVGPLALGYALEQPGVAALVTAAFALFALYPPDPRTLWDRASSTVCVQHDSAPPLEPLPPEDPPLGSSQRAGTPPPA